MSRKWERMVQKNTKTINKSRKKHGRPLLSETVSDASVTIKGRSWTLPIFLIAVGIFCFVALRGTQQDATLYWLTGGSYILLGLFIFWVRRPFLQIGKNFLITRRFTGNKRVEAADIQEISIGRDSALISLRGKGGNWVFSRFYHRMDIHALAERLKEFAERNSVTFKSER
ncbi:hypothetical protein [Paenibacillus xerothermodurans]|uniref:Methyltransferase n=1 Tax=Paenibacillus xerothermodurans TaxID=1977292 RepID=A0A2W1ND24_PAEXE|nr:hypothetical protein [Paenibacillus xerothermodurans]PZE21834.1 hypothetical protein CBW46_005365 [Paenibacillus xerothermodurans]